MGNQLLREVCSPPRDQPASRHPSSRLSAGHQLVSSLELCLEQQERILRAAVQGARSRERPWPHSTEWGPALPDTYSWGLDGGKGQTLELDACMFCV